MPDAPRLCLKVIVEAIARELKRGGLDRMNLSFRDDFGNDYDTWFIIHNKLY